MSLKLFVNNTPQLVEFGKFPGGESRVRIIDADTRLRLHNPAYFKIEMRFEGNDDLINLALLVDAIRRFPRMSIHSISLDMPYLPYARQDRVCNKGESLSVKVVADIINSLKFDVVHVKDVHSAVGLAVLDNVLERNQTYCGVGLPYYHSVDKTVLVSPDAGASKKVMDFAKAHGYSDVVRAEKVRDVATGAILDTVVYSEHIGSKDFLILDDICDGGRTFLELAKKLRPLTDGSIYLYVTHGIFSAGAEVFEGVIDGIYCSNLMGKAHPLIKEI
jgi:ribose-phosphate pyrophosphokinase